MSIKWLVFFFGCWFFLCVLGAGVEKAFTPFAPGGEYTAVLDTVMSFHVFNSVTVAGATVGWLPNMEWFSAVLSFFTFNFSFMKDSAVGWLGYGLVFIPILISMIIAFLLSAGRGTSST